MRTLSRPAQFEGPGKLRTLVMNDNNYERDVFLYNVEHLPSNEETSISLNAIADTNYDSCLRKTSMTQEPLEITFHQTHHHTLSEALIHLLPPPVEANNTNIVPDKFRQTVDADEFHAGAGHLHEGLLHDSVK